MGKQAKKEISVEFSLRGIELLNLSITPPTSPDVSLTTFNFNLGIEIKVDSPNKIVIVLVNVEIRNNDQSISFGGYSVSCIYEIVNLEELTTIHPDGKIVLDPHLILMLNSISLSTVRGFMFAMLKGTYLHNALLPIIDPKQFK